MEADDVELDVEGIDDDDRPSTSSLSLGIDPNELPSVSSHLSLELSQHPWLTFDDQFNPNIPNVILHDDMDESSRATIHQMITEEHSYLQTKKLMRHKNKGMKTLFSVKKNVKKCTKWTKAEKDLFKKGLEEYGHNWKEISDLVKTRDPNQVKNFARKYLLNQAVKADGQDFSSKCSVKVPESLDTHQLPVDDDDDEEDIDVEETSDDEQKDQGLQSTVLFGKILKSSVPFDHRHNLDSHQAGTSILLIPKFEPSESQPPEVDDTKLKTGTYQDERFASYVAGPEGPVLIKTEKPSSEDEDALTICLPGQSANPAEHKQRKKGRKGGKVPRKRVTASSEEERSLCEGESSVIPPAVGSVAATQESSLPGNFGSRRSYGQGYQDGMEQKRMKMAMTPSFAKETGEVGFEGSSEEQDGREYMEIEVKMEKDPDDGPEDLTTPDLKTVFLRNRDYSQLCNERLDGNLVVDRVVKREPDVASCADTQHALHVDGGQRIDDARCPVDLSLKEPKYRTVPSSEKQGSGDPSSSSPMQIPIPTTAGASNKVEKIVNFKSSKEHQDNDDEDTVGNVGHGFQMSSDVGQSRVGEDGGVDYNGFEEESEEETIELPKEEVTLDPGHVTDGEKEAHPVFFDYTSSAFTPERYLTIRNHIIQCWLKTKPGYLNKTSARNGLRNSCDVNQIGAIHRYLESIGAINFGATNPLEQSQRKRRSTLERWSHLQDSDTKTNRLESMRPRKQVYRKYSEGVEEGSGIEKPKNFNMASSHEQCMGQYGQLCAQETIAVENPDGERPCNKEEYEKIVVKDDVYYRGVCYEDFETRCHPKDKIKQVGKEMAEQHGLSYSWQEDRNLFFLICVKDSNVVVPKCITVFHDGTWDVSVVGNKLDSSSDLLRGIPEVLDEVSAKVLVERVAKAKICKGNEEYVSFLRDRDMKGYAIDSYQSVETVRSTKCKLFSGDKDRCCVCTILRSDLASKKRRIDKMNSEMCTDVSSKVNLNSLTKNQLIERARNLQRERKQLLKQQHRLKERFDHLFGDKNVPKKTGKDVAQASGENETLVENESSSDDSC